MLVPQLSLKAQGKLGRQSPLCVPAEVAQGSLCLRQQIRLESRSAWPEFEDSELQTEGGVWRDSLCVGVWPWVLWWDVYTLCQRGSKQFESHWLAQYTSAKDWCSGLRLCFLHWSFICSHPVGCFLTASEVFQACFLCRALAWDLHLSAVWLSSLLVTLHANSWPSFPT